MNAATCTKCRDNFPMPVAADYFDERVIADYTQRRSACTAVPDAEKPCLRPALAALQSEPKQDMISTTELTPHQKTGLEACCQIEAMLRSLLLTAHHGDMEDLQHLMQAALPRLIELNSVSFSGHDPASEDVASMVDRLHGGYIKLAKGSSV